VSGYPHTTPFATRWSDNDYYGHLNNTVYYGAMDTAINTWLIHSAGFDLEHAGEIALCVSSSCEFAASASFPETLQVGLRAGKVGNSSVTWELGILRASVDGTSDLLATGTFVHVFVDRQTRRPVPIPAGIRAAIERDLVSA
jgi:acyl-CoA thioester hydrolase